MAGFIESVVKDLEKSGVSWRDVTIVVPSRRAAVFFRAAISQTVGGASWLPEFITIEDLIEKISGLGIVGNIPALFEFYGVYTRSRQGRETDSFDVFSRWAGILLQDFNEIDRYCIDPDKLFGDLSAIEQIEQWSPGGEETELMRRHLDFWAEAGLWYRDFKKALLEQGIAYQGMAYRQAKENVEHFIPAQNSLYVFAGFNALNTADTHIIRYFRDRFGARVYFDADRFYVDNPSHEAGLFLRQLQDRGLYNRNSSFWTGDHLSRPKKVHIVGAPRQTAQAKAVRRILGSPGCVPEKTAVVLADENMLVPILDSLPENIGTVNVTMGYPIAGLPVASFFSSCIDLYLNAFKYGNKGFYFRDVLSLLSQSVTNGWLTCGGANYAYDFSAAVRENGIVYVGSREFARIAASYPRDVMEKISLLFGPGIPTEPVGLNRRLSALVESLKDHLADKKETDGMEMESLFSISKVVAQMDRYMEKYPFIGDIRTYRSFWQQILRSEKLDFRGEPLSGLQVMGLLETRLLDFENVILTSVNEGILPAGRTENSYIPYDLKCAYGLPTYREKDAVYAYHFYRLLQRAENVWLLYNTETTDLGSAEQSRFVSQIEYELDGLWDIRKSLAAINPSVEPGQRRKVRKTPFVLSSICKVLEEYGLSPSALNSYLRNPVEFYYRYLMGIHEADDVEEFAEADTMGNVVHGVMEELYKPFTGKKLSPDELKKMMARCPQKTKEVFARQTKRSEADGKNYLKLKICEKYAENLLRMDLKDLEEGHAIEIVALEQGCERSVWYKQTGTMVKLKGRIDRIDRRDGTLRLIDYKTGGITPTELKPKDGWPDLIALETNPEKITQLLLYALIYGKQSGREPVQCCVFSPRGGGKQSVLQLDGERNTVDETDLSLFSARLGEIVAGMLDPSVPMEELGDAFYYKIS